MGAIQRIVCGLAMGVLVAAGIGSPEPVAAGPVAQGRRILNFGMDVRADGSSTPVPFYDGQPARGGDDGVVMNGSRQQVDVSIATPGLATMIVHGFELFVDAEDVQGSDSVTLELLSANPPGYVRILTLGYPGKQAEIPVEAGPLGRHSATPYKQDRAPNTLLLSNPPAPASAPIQLRLADYAPNITKGFFRLRLRMPATTKGQRDARFDGVNLQVEVSPAATGGQ